MSDYEQTAVSTDPHFVLLKSAVHEVISISKTNAEENKALREIVIELSVQTKNVTKVLFGTLGAGLSIFLARLFDLL